MMTRRSLILPAAAGVAGVGAIAATQQGADQPVTRKGRLKQSATGGCFGKGMSLEDRCREGARLGLKGLDMPGTRADDFPILKKYGLICTLCGNTGNINRKENQAEAEKRLLANISLAASGGFPNTGVTFGVRTGITDEEGLENSVALLNRVRAAAEDKGVTICLETLNSKVNHPDNQGDHTKWVVEICKRVGSPRVKVLYDIYHMQVQEGDIIHTIRENINYIGHFHTAGVPGRHEIDETQELNYRTIAQAIVDLNYTGYLGHEYTPLGDPLKSLDKAISICDV